MDPEDTEEEGANVDLDSQRKGKCAVIRTSTRQVKRKYIASGLPFITVNLLYILATILTKLAVLYWQL